MYNKLVYYTSFFLVISQLFFLTPKVLAETRNYVLPYPSFMPGHPLYRVKLIKEKIQEIWSFGNFSKFSYFLRQSDKYLIEAKTLFEYSQYLLAASALKKSDGYFGKTITFLTAAKKEGKDIKEKTTLLKLAAQKHREVLEKLLLEMPPEFNWRPEKKEGTLIKIGSLIGESIKIRQSIE